MMRGLSPIVRGTDRAPLLDQDRHSQRAALGRFLPFHLAFEPGGRSSNWIQRNSRFDSTEILN